MDTIGYKVSMKSSHKQKTLSFLLHRCEDNMYTYWFNFVLSWFELWAHD
jgi:hypothetical protein